MFSPKWDMRWLRSKDIKDSPTSQAVLKSWLHTVRFHTGSGPRKITLAY